MNFFDEIQSSTKNFLIYWILGGAFEECIQTLFIVSWGVPFSFFDILSALSSKGSLFFLQLIIFAHKLLVIQYSKDWVSIWNKNFYEKVWVLFCQGTFGIIWWYHSWLLLKSSLEWSHFFKDYTCFQIWSDNVFY